MTVFSRDQKRIDNIKTAICEARRFIEKAQAARDALASKQESTYHSPSFAAAKRASMDLTRALANVRRSPYA